MPYLSDLAVSKNYYISCWCFQHLGYGSILIFFPFGLDFAFITCSFPKLKQSNQIVVKVIKKQWVALSPEILIYLLTQIRLLRDK